MTNLQKIIFGIIGVVLVVLLGFSVFHKSSPSLGDATVSNFPTWYYNGIVIGPQNTLLSQITKGACNISGTGSVADGATTSGTCSAPGTKVGDLVSMNQKTVGGTGPYPIIAASVTSAGVITVVLQNQTGGTAAPSTGAITGVQYLVIR